MIFPEIYNKTYDYKFPAIVEIFNTLYNYLKVCKYKVLILTDHDNLSQFMDLKTLSFYQIN